MTSLGQVQLVAKRLEKMLETSLKQLKLEQNSRKEGETKMEALERELDIREQTILGLQEKVETCMSEKDNDITNLVSKLSDIQILVDKKEREIIASQETINKLKRDVNHLTKKSSKLSNLQNLLDQKEIEITASQETIIKLTNDVDKLTKMNSESSDIPEERVNKYEAALSSLLSGSGNDSGTLDGLDDLLLNNSVESLMGLNDDTVAEEDNPDEEESMTEQIIPTEEESINEEVNSEEEESLTGQVGTGDLSDKPIKKEDNSLETRIDQDMFAKPKELVKSRRVVSVTNRKIKCPVCTENFPNRGLLYNHQRDVGHETFVECQKCEKQFRTKAILQTHELRKHSDNFPFKCTKCPKQFKDSGSCKRHQANDEIHKKMEKIRLSPFLQCNICGKQFERQRRWLMDTHLLTHLCNKKFSCESCGKFYRSDVYLNEHVKSCNNSIPS